MTRRTDRVEDLIRLELSNILLTEINDPRIRMTSVTTVDMSPDFKHALISLSVLGDKAAREGALRAVQKARSWRDMVLPAPANRSTRAAEEPHVESRR